MSRRLDYLSVAPQVGDWLFQAGKVLAASTLEPNLRGLVLLRASQINRCAFCLALHMREAKALGESDDRINGVVAWQEAPWYTERERAALEWTEKLTTIANEHPDDELFARMKKHFSDEELAQLTLAVATINTWNRFNIAFRTPPDLADAVFEQLYGHSPHAVARA